MIKHGVNGRKNGNYTLCSADIISCSAHLELSTLCSCVSVRIAIERQCEDIRVLPAMRSVKSKKLVNRYRTRIKHNSRTPAFLRWTRKADGVSDRVAYYNAIATYVLVEQVIQQYHKRRNIWFPTRHGIQLWAIFASTDRKWFSITHDEWNRMLLYFNDALPCVSVTNRWRFSNLDKTVLRSDSPSDWLSVNRMYRYSD